MNGLEKVEIEETFKEKELGGNQWKDRWTI